jgi:hypothetical protein
MKKYASRYIVVVFLSLMLSPLGYSPVNADATPLWSVQEIDHIYDIRSFGTCIAVDSTNQPHISCLNDNGDILYLSLKNGQWEVNHVDSGSSGTSLVLDSSDNPHICYQGFNGNGGLKYASWTGSGWNIQVVDPEGGDYGISLALDQQGNPHISYECENSDGSDTGELRYASWNGAKWVIQSVEKTGATSLTSALAFDSEGIPHICYHMEITPFDENGYRIYINPGEIRYASWNGKSWSIQKVSEDVGDSICLVFDSKDNAHIAYVDEGISKYASSNGVNWSIWTIEEGESPSLALDKNETAHVCYLRGRYAFYASWNGEGFDVLPISLGISDAVTSALDLDKKDLPHIAVFKMSTSQISYIHYLGSKIETSTHIPQTSTLNPITSVSDEKPNNITLAGVIIASVLIAAVATSTVAYVFANNKKKKKTAPINETEMKEQLKKDANLK